MRVFDDPHGADLQDSEDSSVIIVASLNEAKSELSEMLSGLPKFSDPTKGLIDSRCGTTINDAT
jgi:hypothetical protein